MGKDNNRMVIIYFSLLFVFVISSLVLALFVIPNYFKEYARIASLLVWVGLFAVATQIPNEHGRFKAENEKIKTTLIIVIIYYILYFITGMIMGFKANPYSREFFRMIENILFIVGLAALQEYVRAKLVNNKKKISIYIAVTIIFVLVNIDINSLLNAFTNIENAFKYLCGTILPQIAISALCTYLATTGGFQLIYSYVIPTKLVEAVAPVFPDLDWFILTVFELILVITLIFYNNYEHIVKTNRMTRRELKRESPTKLLPTMIILIVSVGFIAGVFPYKPVAVMSNSMVPVFSRGAVVISQRIGKDYQKVQIGDIIEFRTEKGTVIHRVVNIEKSYEGEYIYTTKGDANLTNDTAKVNQEDVIAIAKVFIPYLGYPSVWFSEIILGKKAIMQL